MNRGWNRLAALVAIVIGAMAVVAGGRVLLGTDPGYFVINWVPLYNYTMGVLTLLVSSALIWRNSQLSLPIAVGTLGLHSLVMLILQTTYGQVVATESTRAMAIRMAAWVIIIGLMALGRRMRQGRPAASSMST